MPDKSGGTRKKISNGTILKALKKTGFNQTYAAKELGMSRSWIVTRMFEDAQLRQDFDDARELMIDSAESQLQILIDSGDFNAVKFALSTRGRQRGYGTSVEITGDSEKPIKIESTMTVEEATTIFRDMLNDDK